MAIGVVSCVLNEHRPFAEDLEWSMDLGKLISDAQLDFGFASGTGLGAVLLAIVLVVLFLSTKLSGKSLADLVASFRKPK